MILKPFRGWRPAAGLTSKIPSYPYDVVGPDEARELAKDDPYSFLHVVRPEVDLPEGVSPYDDQVYARAGSNLKGMQERGWLVQDDAPSFYVYRMTMGEHVQTGLVGAASVAEYDSGRIKKHEHTLPKKENDRVRHMEALSAQVGPVLVAYPDSEELVQVVDEIVAGVPSADFTAPDGIRHQLWPVGDAGLVGRIESLYGQVPSSYIADGHHRAASSSRVAAGRREAGEAGDGPAQFFLTIQFPAGRMQVLEYNRLVRDLGALNPEQLRRKIEEAGFSLERNADGRKPPRRGSYGMVLEGEWYLLEAPPGSGEGSPVERLDVSILTERILKPLLGIGDPRSDPRLECVGGIRGAGYLEDQVKSGRFAAGFVLYPTSLQEVMDVADAGEVMPPKSTWFEPKARSGMVFREI
jgi:uncharacterized protein (DUF1015 family)